VKIISKKNKLHPLKFLGWPVLASCTVHSLSLSPVEIAVWSLAEWTEWLLTGALL